MSPLLLSLSVLSPSSPLPIAHAKENPRNYHAPGAVVYS